MSELQSTEKQRGISVAKPRADVYTVLLGLSLAAILIAILCLVLELVATSGTTRPRAFNFAHAVERPVSEPVAPDFLSRTFSSTAAF